MGKIFQAENGFTLVEIIAVLIIMGILAVVVVSRSTNFDAEVYVGADTLKTHLRYAQTLAMNSSPPAGTTTVCWGISSDGSSYWLFKGTNPADTTSYYVLPDNMQYVTGNRTIDLTAKKIKFASGFTIYFDNRGIPYTSYTNSTTNTPLSIILEITVTSLNGSSSKPVTITPGTGFIP